MPIVLYLWYIFLFENRFKYSCLVIKESHNKYTRRSYNKMAGSNKDLQLYGLAYKGDRKYNN